MQSLNIKEWKLLELQIKKPDTPYKFRMEKMSKFNTLKMWKYLSNVNIIGGANL